ncbi:MAG TPA: Stk1 family PASTA domain-containing Ser/Thr kinase [Gaiellaceae bacterium]|nr:Stk1 family PASTA domain-containing Ser/Thr kinase [Gaiellaceae bacterium]
MAVSDTLINTLFDGRYRILRKLGSGGMANVYLAEDEDLGRRVAIKILSERYANDESFNERFRREAKSAASLSHPNIVSIYDRGEADGIPYIAMEVIEGRSLKELILTRGPLPLATAIDYTHQILDALRFAHRNGIIHRDIKPHNILLGAENRAKVTDFGIARAGASQMTEVGSIMGTAQYLSPEQARGAPVTAASDLYSVGIVLYEMLTGQVPFSGDSAIEIAMKHLNETPRPPSSLRPELTPELDQVVLRALAKNPEDRYQASEEFSADLDRVEAGIPIAPETSAAATAILSGGFETSATQVIPPTETARQHPPTQPAAPRRPPPTYPPRYRYDEPPRKRNRFLPWLLVILLLAGAAVAGWYVYTQIQDELRSTQVAVPNVIGLERKLAVKKIEDEGFQADVQTGVGTAEDRGKVIDQNPDGGTRIEKGSTVRILVSVGPEQVEVPEVVGKPLDEATQTLANAGFRWTTKRVFSPDAPEGEVTKQNPKPGEQAEKGATIALTVSKGQELAAVPDVLQQTRQSAESELRSAGFVPEAVLVDSDSPQGLVVAQDPDPGTEKPKGETVQISVSNGPQTATVPDVLDQDQASAESELQAAGFKVRVVKQDTADPTQDGVVMDQSPAPGLEAQPGSRVTIVVGRFSEPVPRGRRRGNGGGRG